MDDTNRLKMDELVPQAASKLASENEKDIPLCCVCDNVSLECNPFPACSHPACPKCLAMANLEGATTAIMCLICARLEADHFAQRKEMTSQTTMAVATPKHEPNPRKGTGAIPEPSARCQDSKDEEKEAPYSEEEIPSLNRPTGADTTKKTREISNSGHEDQTHEKDQRTKETSIVASYGPSANSPGLIMACLEQDKANSMVAERVDRIQEAVMLVTKYSHCYGCLQAKKCQSPDLFCLDCALSFCARCSGRHKSSPSKSEHIMVPTEGRRNMSKARLQDSLCPRHSGSELALFCKNCEELVCKECVVDKHLNCPPPISAQLFANEERETMKTCHAKHEQVLHFFAEQRKNTVEAMATLDIQKRQLQSKVRKFFSTLLKACMDVEGALLQELETAVSDQTDLLEQQSSEWLRLQECTQQLLDITDTLHFLPSADFLPLSQASKASLNQALREGELLAASAPPHMALNLSLEDSSKRSMLKRIKAIGSMALTVTTHNALTLRKIASSTFSMTGEDKKEPQVTNMVLLTQATIVAADFNNSCLKLLLKEQGGDWIVKQVLTLKWRPFSVALMSSQECNTGTLKDNGHNSSSEVSAYSLGGSSSSYEAQHTSSSGNTSYGEARNLKRQSAVTMTDEELLSADSGLELQIVVTAPTHGCFVVAVPVSGKRNMKVVKHICEEKGLWGVALLDDHTIAAASVDTGRSFISITDTDKNFRHRLPLTFMSLSTPLMSPRHILATSPKTLLVCDHSNKAAIQVSTEGSLLFLYTGHGNQRLVRPEGMCMDYLGHVYIVDSGENSLSVLTKGGALFSKTGNEQTDLNCPQAVCMDRDGYLYVSNDGGKELTVFDFVHTGKTD